MADVIAVGSNRSEWRMTPVGLYGVDLDHLLYTGVADGRENALTWANWVCNSVIEGVPVKLVRVAECLLVFNGVAWVTQTVLTMIEVHRSIGIPASFTDAGMDLPDLEVVKSAASDAVTEAVLGDGGSYGVCDW
jgi:hypothetical protein